MNTTRFATLNINLIEARPEVQQRASMDWNKVKEYQEVLQDLGPATSRMGEGFPPIKVFKDDEGMIWLADGFHRLEAHKRAGKDAIAVALETGTLRDAILYSCQANTEHGLPRSSKDKEKAVRTLLQDSEWCQWSDREIARRTRTSHPFVAQIRAAVASPDLAGAETRKYKRNGKESEMRTEKIGKSKGQAAPDDTALGLLSGSEVADDPAQVQQLAAYDPEVQVEIAGKIYQGQAASVADAALLVEQDQAETEGPQAESWTFNSPDDVIKAAEKMKKAAYIDSATSSATDEHPTDKRFWEAYTARFGQPVLDVCATAENALAKWYFTRTQNPGLAQDWGLTINLAVEDLGLIIPGHAWMNPPFGQSGGPDNGIELWVKKAFETAMAGHEVHALLPANTHTLWWYNWVRFGQVHFLLSKLQYGDYKSGRPSGGDALVIFPRNMATDNSYQPQTFYWDWKGKRTAETPLASAYARKAGAQLGDRVFAQVPDEKDPDQLVWQQFRMPEKARV